MKTTIVYLIGRAGTGKYTIAKELAKSGYIICDNQLINYPVFSLLNYDGIKRIPRFAWNAIATIRRGIFDFLRDETTNSYVMTNVLYETPGDRALFYQVEELAQERGSSFVPIKLIILEEENKKRIQNPERILRQKSINVIDTIENELMSFDHLNLLELDVTNLTPKDAASQILKHLESIKEKYIWQN
jgi:hypothetical protein